MGLILGLVLAVARVFLRLRFDERAARIAEALPGANCGGCGYAGCSELAKSYCRG